MIYLTGARREGVVGDDKRNDKRQKTYIEC